MDCKYIKADTVLPYSSALGGRLRLYPAHYYLLQPHRVSDLPATLQEMVIMKYSREFLTILTFFNGLRRIEDNLQ